MASVLPLPVLISIDTTTRLDGRPVPLGDEARIVAAKLQIDRLIAAIDELLTEQVNAVIHHPRFQALEASWRSLERLTGTAGRNPRIRVRVLDIRWAELCRDLERA